MANNPDKRDDDPRQEPLAQKPRGSPDNAILWLFRVIVAILVLWTLINMVRVFRTPLPFRGAGDPGRCGAAAAAAALPAVRKPEADAGQSTTKSECSNAENGLYSSHPQRTT